MNSQLTDKKALSSINPIALNNYFRSRGWQKYGSYRDTGDIYSFDDKYRILAPASADFIDYAEVVNAAIVVLAKVEGRSELQIFNDLKEADADVIRVRIPEAGADGTISVSQGKELVEQSYSLLMAAACSVSRPQAVYRAGSNKEASAYIEQVQMGQTERGSFILTLLSRVPPLLAGQQDLFGEDTEEPFNRKVTKALAISLQSLKEAISLVNRGGDISAFEDRINQGVSANLCDAVSNLAEYDTDIALNWAAIRPITKYKGAFKVSFRKTDKEILEEASSLLKRREPRFDEVLKGVVTKLERENAAESGKVTFKFIIDGKLGSVTTECNSGLYETLIEAHKDDKNVQLEGDLEPQSGRGWILRNPRHLRIIGDE